MFVISTVFGSTSSDVSCDDDDARIGVCQVQFTLYRLHCEQGVTIECSWGSIFDPETRGQICRTIYVDRCWDTSVRVTAWVQGETDEERKDRIVRDVDDFVAFGVRDLKYQKCDMKDKEGNPIHLISVKDCEELEEAYKGLTTLVGDGHLHDRSNARLNRNLVLNGREMFKAVGATLGRFQEYRYKKGEYWTAVRELEESPFQKYEKDRKIIEVAVHERIHLADWIDNETFDWSDRATHGQGTDRVYRQGR